MPAEYPADKQERSDLFWAFITAKYIHIASHLHRSSPPPPHPFAPQAKKSPWQTAPAVRFSISISFTAQPPFSNISRAFIQNFN
jgi:hypothetical protein